MNTARLHRLPFGLLFLAILAVWGCTQEEEVDVDLPEHQPRLFVECFLQQGKPLELSLSTTEPVDADIGVDGFVSGAQVAISSPDSTFQLKNETFLDTKNRKLYNYRNLHRIKAQAGDSYRLEVIGPQGRTLSGQARFLQPVPLSEPTYSIEEGDTIGRISFSFQDPADEANYYRVLVNKGELGSGSIHDVLISDQFLNGEAIPFRSKKTFAPGDTAWVRVLHLEKAYYDYLRTSTAAKLSNGNPFTQPARVASTVDGGEGIFAAITESRKRWIVQQ